MAAIAMLPTRIDNRVSPERTCSKRYTSSIAMMTAILLLGFLLQIARLFAKSQFRAKVRRTLQPKQKTA
jgi:hypothetical protein